ncbi:dTDP-4-dehydrorhamnose 3,5-epimerase [Paracoccus sp. MC1862]|uniref:dTDP-4-dehydrorhamnose 3,5-epimerase n=1 Tax=Paracoccus sp. MC1862 TaxID=2760307 RepID=UPI001602421D|nr:dTDP-4-dehydrorhamnose 3,5-epimerase [Paracoccus sp. MC1862]MBB1498312.1 dTDP-4-dehydrorhamnose 3,5-epimerase [Paracoccus sp. MC1862]QQO44929.1 dTDP-4-dehydrorhamnose 3,5-epimerase [Paracoccus sp. MC1862]
MRIEETALSGVLVLTPARFGDHRGFFSESWNRRTLEEAGVHLPPFVQDNHSLSAKAGTLRGLHYQAPPSAQGKLVRCGRGALYDVAVDGRRGSETYGQWVGVELTFQNGRQLWVPPGFLHGFVTREDDTEVVYKCTGHYDRAADGAVRWDSLGIDWGVARPILSEKDRAAVPFVDWQSPFEGAA